MKRILLAVVLSFFAGAQFAAQSTPPPQSTPPAPKKQTPAPSQKPTEAATGVAAADKTFAIEVAQGGMTEVELGKLASTKGESADVKQFGQRMADDHGKLNDEL